MTDRFDWFDADVAIQRNADGEVRIYRTREAREKGEAEWSDYLWSEGSYSCDCNRALFFERAIGGDDPERECGETAFAVLWLKEVSTGEILYSEEIA